MKLFTIGDSISQGVMSLGVARTDLAYSTWVARALGVDVGDAFSGDAYRVPEYPSNGLLLDLEAVMRRLHSAYGDDIAGLEWLTFTRELNRVMDLAEEYYERGPGSRPYRDGAVPWFHNVSIYGCDVADSWLLTAGHCKERIEAAPGGGNEYLRFPNASFFRTARRVLNPSFAPELDGMTQLGWLEHHAAGEGVENAVLWLGPNNAVGAAIMLRVFETENRPERRPVTLDFEERTRAKWNLWHPDDFHAEYAELIDRVDAIMRRNAAPGWRVFVANIPHVTIAPVAAGVGDLVPGEAPRYFARYTYVPFSRTSRFVDAGGPHLTEADARHIDRTVDSCNAHIRSLLEERNAAHATRRYHLIDVCEGLDRLAYHRNGGQPTFALPSELAAVAESPIDTRYYHVDRKGRRVAGGILSLDGVHPSAIGQGILAHQLLKAMRAAGVEDADPHRLDWPAIVASDSLYQRPIPLMEEIYEHDALASAAVSAYRALFGRAARRASIKDF